MKFFKRIGDAFHSRVGAYLFYALAATALSTFAAAEFAHAWMADVYPLGSNFPPTFMGIIGFFALTALGFLLFSHKIKKPAVRILHTVICVICGILFFYSLFIAFSIDSGINAENAARGLATMRTYLPYLAIALIVPLPFAIFKKKLTSVKLIAAVLSVLLIGGSSYLFFGLPQNPYKEGWCIDNNGYEINSEEVDRLIAVRPSEIQTKISDIEYYSFIHYGMNTYTGREWGDGTEDPKQFNPTTVDTDQWVRVLKESGSKGIIFTAKHHDGFCLFPSDYTEHDIANSPYMDGKGDLCKQLAESCKKYDMKLGFYLSPWDRHEETYATDAYNDYFANQLTELCTRYGEIFSFWFDGACADDVGDWTYDFDRYYEIIRTLQPNCAIANCGPDVRWIGNEAGEARESEWSVITSGSASIKEIMNNSQQGENDTEKLQGVSFDAADRGSRDLVKNYRDLIWYPAEADVSIHRGWFYTDEGNAAVPRTAEQLADIYFKTVGGNALLLMNVPPDKDGVIAERDVQLLRDFKANVDKAFQNKLNTVTEAVRTDGTANVIDISGADCSYKLGDNENAVRVKLDGKYRVKSVVLREDITQSQRVEEFKVYAKTPAGYIKLYNGTVVGSKKICLIPPYCFKTTDEIVIVFTQSRSNPVLRTVEIYGN